MNGKSKIKRKVVPLTSEEIDARAEHELVISQGIEAFIGVWLALLAMRDGKLFREDFDTFEDYCEECWGISRQHAYRLIEAAKIVESLSPNGRQMIENERQARALAMVPPHLREEVLENVKNTGEALTEQAVTKAVNKVLEQKRAKAKEYEQPAADADDENNNVDVKDAEDDTANAPQETPAERTARRVAAKHEKERLYLARGREYLRLTVKNFSKLRAEDLKTEEARQGTREDLDAADAVFSDVRGLLRD